MNDVRSHMWNKVFTETNYFKKQLNEPKRMTVSFWDYLQEHLSLDDMKILDMACGNGANLYYATSKMGLSNPMMGIDYTEDVLRQAIDVVKAEHPQIVFQCGNLYEPSDMVKAFKPDLLICTQTLSWLDDWKGALKSFTSLNPKYICISSLMYRGRIDAKIETTSYDEDGEAIIVSPYNVHSLPLLDKELKGYGYEIVKSKDYFLDIDVPKGDLDVMSTHTARLTTGENLSISGPLMLPWVFERI